MTITLTREEAQQVLDALEKYPIRAWGTEAKRILQARLAQPEPEPLEYWNAVEGWVKLDEVHQHFDSVSCGTIYKNPGEGRSPLYTAPPQREWQGLTDEEVGMLTVFDGLHHVEVPLLASFARAIEAALRSKNT
jgi:hypothetical protein